MLLGLNIACYGLRKNLMFSDVWVGSLKNIEMSRCTSYCPTRRVEFSFYHISIMCEASHYWYNHLFCMQDRWSNFFNPTFFKKIMRSPNVKNIFERSFLMLKSFIQHWILEVLMCNPNWIKYQEKKIFKWCSQLVFIP